MPTLLYEHVLQHGEKTVLHLRKHLVHFLQCELSRASASGGSRPKDDHQKSKEPGKPALWREGNPERVYAGEEGAYDDELTLIQKKGEMVPQAEAQRHGHPRGFAVHPANRMSVDDKQQEEQPFAVFEKGHERSRSAASVDHVLLTETGSHAPVVRLDEEKGSTKFCSVARDGDEDQQQRTPQCAGKRSATGEKTHWPRAPGKEEAMTMTYRGRAEGEVFQGERGALAEGEGKPCRTEAGTIDGNRLAAFLSSSFPALSQVLHSLFLLGCLPPDPFVRTPETAVPAQSLETRHADEPLARCPRPGSTLKGDCADSAVVAGVNVSAQGRVLLQFLPKASTFSRSLKEVGNALLAEQELDMAWHTYTASLLVAPLCATQERLLHTLTASDNPQTAQALLHTPDCLCPSCSPRQDQKTPATSSAYLRPVAVLLANRSAVHLKQKAPVAALRDATAALQVDPTYAKAWFRRSRALLLLAELFQAECAYQGGAPLSPAAVPQRQELAASVPQKAQCTPFPSRANARFADDAGAATTANGSHYAVSGRHRECDPAEKTAADADACCFRVVTILREEAAYSAARSLPKKSAPVLVPNSAPLAAPAPLCSEAAPGTAAADSQCTSSFSAADTLTAGPSSDFSFFAYRSSSAVVDIPPWAPPAWSAAHPARDGENGVFQLGVCACRVTNEAQQLDAARWAQKKVETQKSDKREEGKEQLTVLEASACEGDLRSENLADSLPPAAPARSRNSAAPIPLSLARYNAHEWRLIRHGGEPPDAAVRSVVCSGAQGTADLEAGCRLVSGDVARVTPEDVSNEQARLTPGGLVGGSEAVSQTRGTEDEKTSTVESPDQDRPRENRARPPRNSTAWNRGALLASAPEPAGKNHAYRIAAGVAVADHSGTPQSHYEESAAAQGRAGPRLRNLFETFAVYVHPDIEVRTGGPMGSSVHWKASGVSGEQHDTVARVRKGDPNRDAHLVLQEYPVAAYCPPAQSTGWRAAVPMVQGKAEFLQQWKKYTQKECASKARAVCAGCFRPVGARQQQLDGEEFVRALYRHCRRMFPAAEPAYRPGGSITSRDSQKGRREAAHTEDIAWNEKPGGRGIKGFGNTEVDDGETRIERVCRRFLSQFLASVQLAAPCPTCNAALFCCPRCRDCSHHVATCGARIGSLKAFCEGQTPILKRSADRWDTTRTSHDSGAGSHPQLSIASAESRQVMCTAHSPGYRLLGQHTSCMEGMSSKPSSPGLCNDIVGELIAPRQHTGTAHTPLGSTHATFWGMLKSASAHAALALAPFDAVPQTHVSGASSAGAEAPQEPGGVPTRGESAPAQAASGPERQSSRMRGGHPTAAPHLLENTTQPMKHGAHRGVAPCASIRREQTTGSGSLSLPEDLAEESGGRRPLHIGSVYLLQDDYHDARTAKSCAGRTVQQEENNGGSGFGAQSKTRECGLHYPELPVAYTAGAALDDGARHLARQIFPLLLWPTSCRGQYHSTSHALKQLAAHLPADADKLCDFVVNAVWLAGEYFSSAGLTAAGINGDFRGQAELPDGSSAGRVLRPIFADMAHGGGAACSKSCRAVGDEIRNPGHEWEIISRVNQLSKNEEICWESGPRHEDEALWEWTHSPSVLQAALAAYGVACTNSFAVTLHQDEGGGRVVGTALYLFASQINHSCSPNTMAIFDPEVPDFHVDEAEGDYSGGGESPRSFLREHQQRRDYRGKWRGDPASPTSRFLGGCALKLRYYGCRGGRDERGRAANKAAKEMSWSAQREALAGEELTISYIAVAGGKSDTRWDRRRRILRENALFDCRCLACEAWTNFLGSIRTAGTKDRPRLFPLLPDHLQGLTCCQCCLRGGEAIQPKPALQSSRGTTIVGPQENEDDALWPLLTLLPASPGGRRKVTDAKEDFAGDLPRSCTGLLPSLGEQTALENVVALKGGFLLLESIWSAVGARSSKLTAWGTEAAGDSFRIARELTRVRQRVTSAASLAALGHSLVLADSIPWVSAAGSQGNPWWTLQPQDSQARGTHRLGGSEKPSRLERPPRCACSNPGCAARDSASCSPGRNASPSNGSTNTGAARRLDRTVVKQRNDGWTRMSKSAQGGIQQLSEDGSRAGGCPEVAGREQMSERSCGAGETQCWVCLHCGCTRNEFGCENSLSSDFDIEALRRSVETSLRRCIEERDPLKRGEQLLRSNHLREVQLQSALVHMAQTRGQLSYEVCATLDVWAMWASECAAIACIAEAELCREWNEAGAPGSVREGVKSTGRAVGEVGARLAELQHRSHLLAFHLHLCATWVLSVRFPGGWREPELCTELYKSAALARNAGRMREGLLLAVGAKYNGKIAYGSRHPIVESVRELIASFRAPDSR